MAHKKVPSIAKVLTAGGGVWNADVWEGVERLSAWTAVGVLVKENTDALYKFWWVLGHKG
jgi:hypothetical protein